jgi:hypothetical protein
MRLNDPEGFLDSVLVQSLQGASQGGKDDLSVLGVGPFGAK